MKLRLILVVLSLLAFFSAWTGGYLYYSSIKQSALEEAENQAVFHTETIKSHLSYSFKENLKSVDVLSKLDALVESLKNPKPGSLERTNTILDRFKTAFQADNCYLINQNGVTIASTNRNQPDSFVGKNYAFRPYFKNAMQNSPSADLVYMALGTTSGRRGIYFSHPVHEENREQPAGVVVIKTSIEPMEKLFNKEYDGIVMLTDPNGIIFITNHQEWIMKTVTPLSSQDHLKIKGYRQFGEGPWKWTGLKIKDDKHVIDGSGNTYLSHKITMDNYPGWHLIFLSDVNTILERVKKPFMDVLGYSIIIFCVFIGITVFILYTQAHREISQRQIAEKELKKAHNDLEKRVLDRTATLRQTVDNLQSEIVERERVERALRGSEEKYRTLTNNLSVGVFRTTPEPKGIYIDVNSAFMRIFGYKDKRKILSLYANALYLHPEDRKKFSQKMVKYGYVKNELIMYKKQDGTPFYGSVTAVAVKDENGNIRHYDGILEDVTELRHAKQEAQRRREEIAHLGRVATMGELSASLAHELNQPLAAIRTNAQVGLRHINQTPQDIDEIREILEDIVSDNRRAGEVIRRLRSLFKKREFEKARININQIIQEVVTLIRSEALTRSVTIDIRLDESLPLVLGDKIHLQQVIINFILNASEAMQNNPDDDKKMVISTRKYGPENIMVEIYDNGTGFEEGQLETLIEPFNTTKPGGMGMGLSLNRTIIKAHSGHMWASNNTEKGATFYFTLPIFNEV